MNSFLNPAVRMLTVLLIVTAFILSVAILPESFSSSAENHAASTPDRGHPNFDIRTEKTGHKESALNSLRSTAGRDSLAVDSVRAKLAEGEASPRQRLPDVVLEHGESITG